MKITSGIPNNFTMTNDTNWLNRKPSGIASISAKKPNNIFSMTSRRATSFSLSQEAYMFQILYFVSQT